MVQSDHPSRNADSNSHNSSRYRRKIWNSSSSSSSSSTAISSSNSKPSQPSQYETSRDGRITDSTSLGSNDRINLPRKRTEITVGGAGGSTGSGIIHSKSPPITSNSNISDEQRLKHQHNGKPRQMNNNFRSYNRHYSHGGAFKQGGRFIKETSNPGKNWSFASEFDERPADNRDSQCGTAEEIYSSAQTGRLGFNSVPLTNGNSLGSRRLNPLSHSRDFNGYSDGGGVSYCEGYYGQYVQKPMTTDMDLPSGRESRTAEYKMPPFLEHSVATAAIVNSKEELVRAVSDRYDD